MAGWLKHWHMRTHRKCQVGAQLACESRFGRWELGLLRPHQRTLGLTERPWLKELMGKAVKKI